MTQPMPSPAPKPSPAPEQRRVPDPSPEPEPSPASVSQSAPETASKDRRSAKTPGPPGNGGAAASPPDDGTIEGIVSFVAERLGRVSRQTRQASFRSLLALAALIVIAIGAVAAGLIVKNTEFWTVAGGVFYMALAVVIVYAATKLGVVSETADFLGATLKTGGRRQDKAAPDRQSKAVPSERDTVLKAAGRLEEEGLLAEAELAYTIAADVFDDRDAGFWLGKRYLARKDYAKGEQSLLKAARNGHALAAYLLGVLHRIHGQAVRNKFYSDLADQGVTIAAYIVGRNEAIPDGDRIKELVITPSPASAGGRRGAEAGSEMLKSLANALPDFIEFWQAYFVSLLKNDGESTAGAAIDRAVQKYPDNAALRLLQVRFGPRPSYISTADFPDYMHPELYFQMIANDVRKRGPKAFEVIADFYISHAEDHEESPPWRAQLLAIKAAREYVHENFTEAAQYLKDALACGPSVAGPLSLGDVESLALILKNSGDVTARSLVSELTRARPNLEGVLSEDEADRNRVFAALVSSMVPGIDIAAPVPSLPGSGVLKIPQLIDLIDGSLGGEDAVPPGQ